MTWAYRFSRVNHRGSPVPCAEMCGAPAHYRLIASKGDQHHARDLCINHSAQTAAKLSLQFPPTNTETA